MFAPMSSGGSDDVWHVQDEPASLKPGRYRAYLPNQLLSHNQPSSSATASNRAIPFSRDANLTGRSNPNKRQRGQLGADKGKARAVPSFFDDVGSGTEASDGGLASGFGTRFAAGLGLARKSKKKKLSQQQHEHEHERRLRQFGSIAPRFGAPAIGGSRLDERNERDLASDPLFDFARADLKTKNSLDYSRPVATRRPLSSGFQASPARRRGQDRADRPRSWVYNLVRPSRETVETWLDSWWKRWFALAVLPSLVVWFWCAVPFPKTDPYDPNLPWCNPGEDGRGDDPSNPPWCYPHKVAVSSMPSTLKLLSILPTVSGTLYAAAPKILAMLSGSSNRSAGGKGASDVASLNSSLPTPISEPEHLTVDANFWFFLIFYYGIYVAVALVYITQLFSLYRLNWWPAALGARTSYTFFWIGSLVAGWALHELDPFGTEGVSKQPEVHPPPGNGTYETDLALALSSLGSFKRTVPDTGGGGPIDENDIQWQRKTLWVGLAFATMAMPALVCFVGLRRSGRQTYRHSLTDHQKTFLERQLSRRIPSSYIRFLWFMTVIGLGLFALIAGQGYASVYLATLPHTGLDGIAYVSFWTLTVNGMALVSHWILEEKVRSRALLFVFKYYYFLVYFIFYRNLFARLRSFDQFALVQLLSSFWVCIWYPFSMSSICHRITQYFNPQPKSWEEYVESVGLAFYLRNLAQNTTMLAFLGWVSILHFGSNQQLYPFFAYDNKHDPYNYQLTMLGSLAIWGSELASSYVARVICYFAFEVDVTNLGLDEMREFPEVLTTIGWGAVHTLMDMLLFLIKLNFR
ncbi:hypothetical protein ACQY0O_005819 [Thecaphora frezii]